MYNISMEETLYFNGEIITMENGSAAQAVLVQNGRIAAVGTLKEVSALASPNARKADLQGKTMIPAFIDAHSHITSFAAALIHCSLASAKNFQQIADLLAAHIKLKALQPGQWVIGVGYDHNDLEEKAHPGKALLDAVAPQNPVVITHASGHIGVANSLALEKMGITSQTPNPTGGVIGRMPGSSEPSGYLEENAFLQNQKFVPAPTEEEMLAALKQTQDIYLRFGITLVQDGLTKEPQWQLLSTMAKKGLLKTDVVAYIDLKESHPLLSQNLAYTSPFGRLSIGGYKIFLDGSPQGRTAWLSQPYLNGDDGYCGYPIYTQSEVVELITTALKERRQILAHCNGDAAAEQYISAMEEAVKRTGIAPLRPVMVHGQMVRPDQLDRMAALGMIPSYFVAHTYYWGDVHVKNLGLSRASGISPAKTTLDKGIPFTFHQDSPVIAPNMLETMWCAVNRLTKSGVPLGPQERITPYQALKAVTLNAAYQYGQENRRGSIKKGKVADFVILSQNPLSIACEKIRDIRVLATIKEGRLLYRRDQPSLQ